MTLPETSCLVELETREGVIAGPFEMRHRTSPPWHIVWKGRVYAPRHGSPRQENGANIHTFFDIYAHTLPAEMPVWKDERETA